MDFRMKSIVKLQMRLHNFYYKHQSQIFPNDCLLIRSKLQNYYYYSGFHEVRSPVNKLPDHQLAPKDHLPINCQTINGPGGHHRRVKLQTAKHVIIF